MPLRLKLAANELIVINGAIMVNGSCATALIIRNFAYILREKDILQEPDANTPVLRLYYAVQAMVLQPQPSKALIQSYRLALFRLSVADKRPGILAVLNEVDHLVTIGNGYPALKKLQTLTAVEATSRNIPPHDWRRAGSREAAPHSPKESSAKIDELASRGKREIQIAAE
jgi:flagellar biosynthesis repressor protein FlbT